MKSSAIRLPRRRFLKLKGNMVELAVGLLAAVMIETQSAHAETLPADTGAGDTGPVPTDALPEAIAAIDPEAIRTLSIDELKQLLDAEALASLGLDSEFIQLLDVDASAAIRRLETAFREKIKVAAKGEAKIAAAGDAHGDVAHAERASADTHHDSALDGGFSPLWLLAGLAVVGGGVALAGSGGGDKDGPAPNVVPSASADSFTTAEDTAVTFDVRTNDSDRDGGTLSVTQINGTAITTTAPVTITGGVVSLNGDGRLTFTPAANFNGSPTFTYTVSDGQGGTATATVTGTVTAVNDAPVATNDSFTTAEDTAVTITVLANDRDVDGDTLTVTQINGTAITAAAPVTITGGVVSLNAAGGLLFTPTANFNGSPSFTYTVSDGKGGTATATVNGTVTPVNDAPVNALPASVAPVAQGSAVAINGLSIADVDGGNTSFTTTLSVAHGVLVAGTVAGGATISGAGTGALVLTGTLAQVNATLATVGYTSASGYVGAETLTMVTSDGQATDTDTLNLTVAQVTQGVVIDGYVAGARIFFDANGNGAYDEGEVVAVTDAQGRFTLVGEPVGTMIALGGVNTDTGLPNTIALKAPAGSTAVTPLTTLVAELTQTGVDVATAQAQIARAFGLPEGVDLGSFDFLAPTADPAIGFAIQKVATQIATVMIQAQAAGVSATAVSAQIAQLAKTGAVDLGNPRQLANVLVAAGTDAGVAAATAQRAAAINQAVASATSPDALVDTVRDLNQPDANLPPVTLADAAKFGLGMSVQIGVLANDTDPNGGPLSVVAVEGRAIAIGQSVDVTNGTVTLGENGTLTFTPATDFFGSQSFSYTVADSAGATAIGTATASLDVPLLMVSAEQLDFAITRAADLAAAGVETIVVDTATIDDAQANTLVTAGIDFAEAGDVTLQVEGTHLNTTLKSLQALHVDAIAVGAGVTALSLEAGGSLDSLSVGSLPQFDVAQSDAALDVTLNVDPGTLGVGVDLTQLAAGLRDSGIDHLGVAGNGALALDLGQAQALAGAGLDFATTADITLDVDAGQLAGIASDPALLAQLHVDHLDVAGAATITEAQAAGLIGAGVDFVEGDDVTLAVEGTHMSTTLKGLQGLHVDAVAVGAGVTVLSLEAGGALDGITTGDLPSFVIDQSDAALDVTLTVDAGMLGRDFDMFALAPALADAGIDHIGVAGSGTLGLSLQQAWGVSVNGMDFTPAADVVVHLGATELAAVTAPGEAALLGQINVDTLDVIEDQAVISDDQAANLVAAGLHFADGDDITVAAEGTQMSTTLRGLHDLKVDVVAGTIGGKLVIDAGDLTGISADDLPQFDVAQSDDLLDVTLRVDASQLSAIVELAQGLADAGIDHIVTNQDIALLDPDQLAVLDQITDLFGIDFTYEPFDPVAQRFLDPEEARVEAELIQEMRSGFEGADDDGTGGVYRITDGAHHALAESGLLRAYTADTLVIDGTGSSDKLLATLKDIGDMGVDEVRLDDGQNGPVYVDLGLDGLDGDSGMAEIRALLRSLGDGQNGPDPIFQGSDKVALVMDADAAHALAQVEGGVEQLKAIGITEIDVLTDADDMTPPAFGDVGIEVKLIGQDDELYRQLHHDR
ncbi:Ig-like domain-containing protein [Sphingomonas sp. Leaf22]|uniref:Ig-like domain-containing protein n=1 Tax=Sphingomonas sp. Leaf22 TaxID=1735687 RepID=UPI0012E2EECB|nr:tandem-95 repeat protein [Sphingomonas sp. Leaf22]